jgi:alkylation response protein AidB-like acyl-CoA dehydrogenase
VEFKFTAEDEEFRGELRAFMKAELPNPWEGAGRYPEDDDWDLNRVIRQKMAEKGWLTMHWPEEYGGQNASPVKSAIYNEEIAYLRAPGRDIFGVRMLGPTLMIHGSDEQKRTHLPAVAKGEIQWCQGYSEPESGSDLASLSTRAVRDGDELVINGGKVWTTMAHRADWIMLLTRTDPDAPKHRGISFVLVDMKSPGVTVRPIINMAGGHEFNQVTFDDVRVPRANVVGEEDRGWYVAVTLLDFERSGIDYSAAARRLLDDTKEFATDTKQNGVPLIEIPWVRTLMADRYIECEVARLMAYNVAYMQSQELIPTKEASMSKVFGSETVQRATEAALDILGMYGTLGREDKWAPLKGRVQENWMNAFAGTIAAGTSEIQRNIIAGRGLGLPRG